MLLCNPRSLGATSDWPLDALPADAAERPTRPGCRQPRRLRASRAFGSSHASQEVFCFLQREKCASRFLYLHFLFAYSISTPKEEGIVRCRTTVSLCLLVMAGVHLAPRKRLSLNCATFPEAHVGNAQEANCEKMRAVQADRFSPKQPIAKKCAQFRSLSERKYLVGDSSFGAGPAQRVFSCVEHGRDILRVSNWPYPAVTGFQFGISAIRWRKSFSKL